MSGSVLAVQASATLLLVAVPCRAIGALGGVFFTVADTVSLATLPDKSSASSFSVCTDPSGSDSVFQADSVSAVSASGERRISFHEAGVRPAPTHSRYSLKSAGGVAVSGSWRQPPPVPPRRGAHNRGPGPGRVAPPRAAVAPFPPVAARG